MWQLEPSDPSLSEPLSRSVPRDYLRSPSTGPYLPQKDLQQGPFVLEVVCDGVVVGLYGFSDPYQGTIGSVLEKSECFRMICPAKVAS